ncbi:hypothetical protein C8Q73DRAFT_105343 [Cubamyces lactineus]|nr:hypothetical protein C8Q73DRAFT_105343 [Cubamyces lactineus]
MTLAPFPLNGSSTQQSFRALATAALSHARCISRTIAICQNTLPISRISSLPTHVRMPPSRSTQCAATMSPCAIYRTFSSPGFHLRSHRMVRAIAYCSRKRMQCSAQSSKCTCSHQYRRRHSLPASGPAYGAPSLSGPTSAQRQSSIRRRAVKAPATAVPAQAAQYAVRLWYMYAFALERAAEFARCLLLGMLVQPRLRPR